jgi:hypothetical protein
MGECESMRPSRVQKAITTLAFLTIMYLRKYSDIIDLVFLHFDAANAGVSANNIAAS